MTFKPQVCPGVHPAPMCLSGPSPALCSSHLDWRLAAPPDPPRPSASLFMPGISSQSLHRCSLTVFCSRGKCLIRATFPDHCHHPLPPSVTFLCLICSPCVYLFTRPHHAPRVTRLPAFPATTRPEAGLAPGTCPPRNSESSPPLDAAPGHLTPEGPSTRTEALFSVGRKTPHSNLFFFSFSFPFEECFEWQSMDTQNLCLVDTPFATATVPVACGTHSCGW